MLATVNTVDFLYTCETHLADHQFATRVADPAGAPSKPAVNPEDIAKVKKEWEEQQKIKAAKAREKEKDKDKEKGKDTDTDKRENDEKEKSPTPLDAITPGASPSPPASSPTTPSHEKYTLHRDMFAMRQAEHRRRRQTAQAKQLAPRLPGAPRSNFPAPTP